MVGLASGDGARDGAPQEGAATHPPAAKVRGAQPAAVATALDGLEARAKYWRSRVNVTRSNAGLARRCERWASRREALLRHERGVLAAKELEECTFTPKLNAHSLWIDADRASSTGEQPELPDLASAHPSTLHRVRTPLCTATLLQHYCNTASLAHPGLPRHLRRAAADRGPAPDGHTRRVAKGRVRGCRGGGAARGRGAAAVLV